MMHAIFSSKRHLLIAINCGGVNEIEVREITWEDVSVLTASEERWERSGVECALELLLLLGGK